MLELLAMWFGRNVKVRGSGRLLSALFPCRDDALRAIRGVRVRHDGLLMELDSRNCIDWTVIFRGDYEPRLTNLLRTLLPPGGVAVDAGANIGCHTLTMAEAVGQDGHVLSFEPNPVVREALKRNIALNGFTNVRVYDCALGDEATILPLKIPQANSAEAANMGLASLVALDTPHEHINVTVRTMDALFAQTCLPRLDFVKIDVQGYECKVLEGMRGILANYSPAVAFEFEDWAWRHANASMRDAAEIFEEFDYDLFGIAGKQSFALEKLLDVTTMTAHADVCAFKRNDPRLQQFVF